MYISATCAGKWSTPCQGVCYVFSTDTKSWDDARTDCKSKGGTYDLAIIDNADLNKFVSEQAHAHFGVNYFAWIGLDDKETEGTFRWVDGSNLTFSNWHSMEPNHAYVMQICTGSSIITYVIGIFYAIAPDLS